MSGQAGSRADRRSADGRRPGDGADPPSSDSRRSGTWRAGSLLGKILDPAARARGFAEFRILSDWPAIVGPDLARRCHPVAIRWARGRRNGGVLHLAASAAAALELQHGAPQLIERVNRYFGFQAIWSLRFQPVQGTAPARPSRVARRPLEPAEEARIAAGLTGVADADLRAALLALGRQLAADAPPHPALPSRTGAPSS